MAGNRIRRHLPRCVEAHTGLRLARNPRRRDRRRISQKTAHISVGSKERPHWLELQYVADCGELVQMVAPTQPWHGGPIVIPARNHLLRACLRCGRPESWKFVPEYGEYEER